MRRFQKGMSLLMAAAMVSSMAACGNNGRQAAATTAAVETTTAVETTIAASADTTKEAAGSEREAIGAAMDEVTLNIRIMNEPTNLERAVEEYEKIVADDPILSKVHLNISYVTGADYKDKLTTALTAQEDYDLMFCGSWHGLDSFISQGCFADLTSYYNNDAFPGLQAGFPEEYAEAAASFVKDDSGNYTAKNYTIPLADYYEDIRGVYYREDLREKYGCAEITDDASLRAYLDTVMENEPNMIGWSMYNGFFYYQTARYSGALDHVLWTDSTQCIGEETPFYLGLNEDATKVLNAVVMGDAEEEFAKMPKGYQDDFITAYELEHLKWADVLDPTRGTTDESGKDAIVTYGTLGGFVSMEETLEEKYSDASYGFYATEEDQRNQKAGAIVSAMKTNNQLVVPAWSKKIDATMYFLDWLFGSQEHHDLFQYGVEGVDWKEGSNGGIVTLDVAEDQKYFVPSYSFTANPYYYRINEKLYDYSDAVVDLFDYMLDDSTYTKSPLSGFVFDTSAVESQIANVTALSSQLMTRFALYGDETAAKINEWHTDAEAVGLEEIRAELIKQAQEFLNMKNALK